MPTGTTFSRSRRWPSGLGTSGPTPQPRRGAGLRWWYDRLLAESKLERRAVRQCLAVGLAMQSIVVCGFIAIFSLVARYQVRHAGLGGVKTGAIFGIGCCLLMLIGAVFTKPDGRAEAARRIVEEGFRSAGRQGGEPITCAVGILLMLISLYGSFAIVEAACRVRARWRLRKVDLIETARVLSEIADRPMGASPRALLKWGQPIDSLRGPVALLMLDGWIELVDNGRTVVQRSDTMRSLHRRHPLAEVFESVGA